MDHIVIARQRRKERINTRAAIWKCILLITTPFLMYGYLKLVAYAALLAYR